MAEQNHAGHRGRMKDKFRKSMNFGSFAEHEILEMLLYYCYPQRNTNNIAHELIKRFGSVSKVLESPYEELVDSGILGEGPALSLKFFNSLNIYLHKQGNDEKVDIRDIPKLKTYISEFFYGSSFEQFKLFFVDNSYTLKSHTDLKTGTGNSVEVSLREVVKAVLNSGATYFFIAHNHPGAAAAPSDEDILFTRKILTQLRSMDIHLLDHFIIGNDGISSMRQSGLIYDHEC